MKEAFRNLMEMNPQNLIPEVYISLLIIWVMVVISCVWSVLGSRMNGVLKAFWAIAIVALPLVGALAYSLFCFTRLDFRMLSSRAELAKQLSDSKKRAKAAAADRGITA